MSKAELLANLYSANGPIGGGTAGGLLYLNGSKTLTTGSALQFDGTKLTSAVYQGFSNATGQGEPVTLQAGTGTGQAGIFGGNGYAYIAGGGATSPWTSFSGTAARRRGGILLQAGTAQADAGNTYVNGSVVQIFGGAATNNGTTTGTGGEARLASGSATRPDGSVSTGATVQLSGAAVGSGGTAFITAGSYVPNSGTASGASIWAYGGNTTSGGDLVLRAGNADVGLASGSLTLFTGGLERMRVDAAGNVGIGTVPTSNKLELVTETSGGGTTFTNYTANSNGIFSSFRSARGTVAAPAAVQVGDRVGVIGFAGYTGSAFNNGVAIMSFIDSGTVSATSLPQNLVLYTTPDGSLARTETMRIAANGNVGIGTNNPLRRLDIAGGGFAFTELGGANRNIHWGDTTGVYPVTITGSSSSGNGFLSFNTNTFGNGAIERMRVDSTGNVGIGTLTPGYSGGVNRRYLSVVGNGDSGILQLANSVAAQPNNGNIEWIDVGNTSSTSLRNAYITSGSTGVTANNRGSFIGFGTKDDGIASAAIERMRVDSTGRVLIGTVSPILTSLANLQVAGTGHAAGLALARNDTPTSGGSITGIDSYGYDGSVYSVAGTINFRAAENWSTTNHGTDIQFRVTASGSGGALFEAMRIASSGNVGIGTNTPRGVLDVTGSGLPLQRNWAYISAGNVGGFNPSGNVTLAIGSNFSSGNSETNLIWGNSIGSQQYLSISKWTGTAVVEQLRVTSAGHLVPGATNAYDLGSTTNRWRNIYTQDLHLSNGIGDYTVVEGEEELYLVNNKTGKHFKFALIPVDPSEVPAKSEAA
jgi:hypothetical protein